MVNYNAEVDDCGICIDDGLASQRQHCGAAQVPVAYYSSSRSLDASWPGYREGSCSGCEYEYCWEEWETTDERHTCERCVMNLHELEQPGCGLNRSCERRRVSPNGGPSNCHNGATYEHDTANRRSKICQRTGRCPRLDDTNYPCPNARQSHSDRRHPIEDWLPDFDCHERSRTCHREHEYEHWSTDETRGSMNTVECGHRDERRYIDNAGRHWGYRRSESREGRHVDTRRRGSRHSANERSRSGVRRVRFRE
ncbi:hypothetical protein EDB80DRAFT_771765 [Ilyonectria destructans]|nr:hypothetical protein EDB80DRAFT_771765 [Ilyonectria destructans]